MEGISNPYLQFQLFMCILGCWWSSMCDCVDDVLTSVPLIIIQMASQPSNISNLLQAVTAVAVSNTRPPNNLSAHYPLFPTTLNSLNCAMFQIFLPTPDSIGLYNFIMNSRLDTIANIFHKGLIVKVIEILLQFKCYI